MRIKYIAVMVIALVLVAGCGNASPSLGSDGEPTKYEAVNQFKGVTMEIKEGTVSATGLTVTMESKVDARIIYGEHFELEKKIDGNWDRVPVAIDGGYGFDDVAYELAPASVKEWTVDWEWLYGKLNAGEYRIVKDFLETRDTGGHEKHHLAAEFMIQ